MRQSKPGMLFAFLLGMATYSLAQAPTVDLALDLIVPPPAITPPGSTGEYSFIVTNLGPEPIGEPGVSSFFVLTSPLFPAPLPEGSPFIFWSSPGTDCAVVFSMGDPPPGGEPEGRFLAWFTQLSPGESARCDVTYLVKPHLTEDWSFDWQYVPVPPSTDPDMSNNSFTLNFRLGLPTIPTLTPIGLTIVAAALVLAFAILRRVGSPSIGHTP